MREGIDGFVFPEVDESLCVGCDLCKRVCGLQNKNAFQTEGPWYAAAYRGDSSRSASGGAFYALARSIVETGGVAFGAAYVSDEEGLGVRHVMARDVEGLAALQGSKYVQSDARACFPEVLHQLELGREVLFSGTPCQVAGLRGYLGRDWPRLLTVDIVCHGVPSERMLRAYLDSLAKRRGERVVDARFRCKRDGWKDSLLLDVVYEGGDHEYLPVFESPYYDLFFSLKTFRESCYSCPFAGPLRSGDLTIGDFWGVERSRPDALADGRLDRERGVSCLLANNQRGREALGRHGGGLELFEVTFEDIAKGNGQLCHPSELPDDRALYLEVFCDGGWEAVERLWRYRRRGVRYKSRAKRLAKKVLPAGVVAVLKRLLSRG